MSLTWLSFGELTVCASHLTYLFIVHTFADTRRALARYAPPAQRNQQQYTTQDQEHRGHERRYEHTKAHAKADAQH